MYFYPNVENSVFDRYLSALNISERTNEANASRDNEIRTRARAEEKRERFKIVDNLTRVIDDVALNYSANHQGDVPSAANAEKKKTVHSSNTNWLEGEISVKSFAKMAGGSPTITQRARKSFPTPSTSRMILKSPFHMGVNLNKNGVGSPSTNKEPTVATTSSSHPITTAGFTSQVTTISTSVSTTFRTVSSSALLTNYSSTLTSAPPNVVVSSMVSSPAHGKPHEALVGSAMSHVILFPNPPGVNYGSPIVSPVLGMVSVSEIENNRRLRIASCLHLIFFHFLSGFVSPAIPTADNIESNADQPPSGSTISASARQNQQTPYSTKCSRVSKLYTSERRQAAIRDRTE